MQLLVGLLILADVSSEFDSLMYVDPSGFAIAWCLAVLHLNVQGKLATQSYADCRNTSRYNCTHLSCFSCKQ